MERMNIQNICSTILNYHNWCGYCINDLALEEIFHSKETFTAAREATSALFTLASEATSALFTLATSFLYS